MNRETGGFLSEEDHIKQAVADILTTQVGSRIQRRDYGSNIPKLLAQPINGALLLKLSAAAVIAINRWERRIIINQLTPEIQQGKIIATLTATLNGEKFTTTTSL